MDIEASAASVQSTTSISGPSHEHPEAIIAWQTSPATPANSGQVRRRGLVKADSTMERTKIERKEYGSTNAFWQHFEHRREQGGKDHCVLIAWRSCASAYIVDVPVTDPEDEELVWNQIRAHYYARRGTWRKYISLADVEKVERVKIRFAGFNEQKDAFIGKVEPLDTSGRRETLKKSAERWRACVDPREGPGCVYIPSTDTWEHDQLDCPLGSHSDPELTGPCPLESEQKTLSCLTIMEGLWYLTHCFHDPSVGAQQKSLNLEPDEPLILRYSDFQSTGNYQPRDAIFRGLLLREREFLVERL
ncbi:hypothetical protein, variant [Exophiala oligosperma]|uniref:Uncharacterized protein n=1 Tax=Exophiala oligosperma TaxID=215243 RepID=A0A0D2DHA9_9EURO|nr:hypothetical protein, variant [Exophiala oligosperma]KIW41800.1 hypothetical protein, variant [Exophiala oligosperma]